jgi:hypothetical protein
MNTQEDGSFRRITRTSSEAGATPIFWGRPYAVRADADDEATVRRSTVPGDRMRPSTAAALTGALGAFAAVSTLNFLVPAGSAGSVGWLGRSLLLGPVMAYGVAYVGAGALGAVVGPSFATLTRRLNSWLPLAVWAFVVFASVITVALALVQVYGSSVGLGHVSGALFGAVMASVAAYAFVATLKLPLRRRAV